MPLLNVLKKPVSALVFLGIAFLFFDVQYSLMLSLPGSRDFMCVMGVNLTPENIVFSLLQSVLIALLIVNIASYFTTGMKIHRMSIASFSGISFGVGAMTIFCPYCILPAISFFGLSLGFEFFNTFNGPLKIISLLSLILSLFLVNRQLVRGCAL